MAGEDIFIGITENGPQDWSFGHGRAPYTEGLLAVAPTHGITKSRSGTAYCAHGAGPPPRPRCLPGSRRRADHPPGERRRT
ncbi:tautomerase family protein [Streptomyces cellostaticus]|uniref:tautomerase family protein n=1 Tax=Streptomyces cellostaticus TaxID=67285 RepID=UPI001FC9ABF3|nr:tautomerase family protein [Streptomyces cellostaticus]